MRLAISQAKVFLSDEDKDAIREIEKVEMLIDSEEEGEEEIVEPQPHSQHGEREPQNEANQEDAKTDEREKRRAGRASGANDEAPSKLSGKEDP